MRFDYFTFSIIGYFFRGSFEIWNCGIIVGYQYTTKDSASLKTRWKFGQEIPWGRPCKTEHSHSHWYVHAATHTKRSSHGSAIIYAHYRVSRSFAVDRGDCDRDRRHAVGIHKCSTVGPADFSRFVNAIGANRYQPKVGVTVGVRVLSSANRSLWMFTMTSDTVYSFLIHYARELRLEIHNVAYACNNPLAQNNVNKYTHHVATWRGRERERPASRRCRPRPRYRWSCSAPVGSQRVDNHRADSSPADDQVPAPNAGSVGPDAAQDAPGSRRTDAAAAASGHRMHRRRRTSASVARRCRGRAAHRNLYKWSICTIYSVDLWTGVVADRWICVGGSRRWI